MKFLNVKISLAGMTLFLLVGASLLVGFSSMIPTVTASPQIDNSSTTAVQDDAGNTMLSDSTSLNATTNTVELAEEPFAIGRHTIVSENTISETETRLSFEGSTTITLPNATETITTRDTGEGTFSLLPGYGAGTIRGHLHMTTEDGSESVIADFTEFNKFESPIAIGIAFFSTNSTGMLAPLNNMVAVFLDEEQPNQDALVSFFEWKGDDIASITSNNSNTIAAN